MIHNMSFHNMYAYAEGMSILYSLMHIFHRAFLKASPCFTLKYAIYLFKYRKHFPSYLYYYRVNSTLII